MNILDKHYTFKYRTLIFVLKILDKIYKLNPTKPLFKNEIYDKIFLLATLEIDNVIIKNNLDRCYEDIYYWDSIEYTVWSDIKF